MKKKLKKNTNFSKLKGLMKPYSKYIKVFIVVFLVLIVLDFGTASTFKSTFSLQYDGIGKGLNIDGTRFDIKDLTSEDVLKEVYSVAGVEYNKTHKNLFTAQPVLPGGIVDRIKTERLAGNPYTYFPNEFQVTLKPSWQNGLDPWKAYKLSKSYALGYQKHMINSLKIPLINIQSSLSKTDLNRYDYPEIAVIFENQYNMLGSYLNLLKEMDPTFRTKENLSFNDFISAVSNSQFIEMNDFKSFVDSNALTKNKARLIQKYEFMIKRYDLEKSKDYADYANAKNLVNTLEKKKSSVVIPNAMSGSIAVTMVDDAYDGIAENQNQALINAGKKTEDVKYLQNEISRYTNNNNVTVKATEIDQRVGSIKNGIAKYITKIQLISDEFFVYKYGNSVKSITSGILSGGRGLSKLFIFSLSFIILMYGYFNFRVITQLVKQYVNLIQFPVFLKRI